MYDSEGLLKGPTMFTVSSTSSWSLYSWPGCFSKFFDNTVIVLKREEYMFRKETC